MRVSQSDHKRNVDHSYEAMKVKGLIKILEELPEDAEVMPQWDDKWYKITGFRMVNHGVVKGRGVTVSIPKVILVCM